jgi:hypothetical protein
VTLLELIDGLLNFPDGAFDVAKLGQGNLNQIDRGRCREPAVWGGAADVAGAFFVVPGEEGPDCAAAAGTQAKTVNNKTA